MTSVRRWESAFRDQVHVYSCAAILWPRWISGISGCQLGILTASLYGIRTDSTDPQTFEIGTS